jgi:TPR repeat protein
MYTEEKFKPLYDQAIKGYMKYECQLGLWYRFNIKKDLKKSKYWLIKAGIQGCELSQIYLFIIFENGESTTKRNINVALYWVRNIHNYFRSEENNILSYILFP